MMIEASTYPRNRRWFGLPAWGMILSLAFFGQACRVVEPVKTAVAPAPQRGYALNVSEQEMRERLATFYIRFVNTVETATSYAATVTEDPDLQVRLLRGRLQVTRACRQACLQRQPMAAFVDTWSLCLQLNAYLDTDTSRNNLGAAHEQVRQAVQELNRDMEGLGRLFLQQEQLADLEEKLTRFAWENPMSTQHDLVFPSVNEKTGIPQFGWLLNMPLAPFRALEGVDQTAQAVHELTGVASRFTQISEDLPRELQWNMEMLLLQTRRETSRLLAELEQDQTNIIIIAQEARQALVEASNVVARVDPTLETATQTLQAAQHAAQSVESTLKTYTQMMQTLYPPKPPPPAGAPAETKGRPFDILDYARTADGIAEAADGLTRVLVEFQNLVETNSVTLRLRELEGSAQQTIRQTETSSRQLVDHIAKRAVQVIVVLVVALLLYRAADRFLFKRAATP